MALVVTYTKVEHATVFALVEVLILRDDFGEDLRMQSQIRYCRQ